jgi:secreted protein with Ig-like and vWFA domain
MSPLKVGAGALALGGLGALLARNLRAPTDYSNVNNAVSLAVGQARGQQVAKLLEQARLEKAIAQNQARIAQANPTLYTSVMAGRRVPTGAVVLGGRPRMDLMRELAASMDSGAFQKRDPLSDLMG